MQLDVVESPNGDFFQQLVFAELGAPRKIRAIRAWVQGRETLCDITGAGPDGPWVPAYAAKVMDSTEGHVYLIYGGLWGIRLRPQAHSNEDWDFKNPHQWGESHKVYGSEEDIVYEPKA